MATDTNTADAYLRTKVLTAPPEQLRLMLLDGAIRFATQGREAMVRKDFEGVYNGVSQCRNIVFELMTSIGAAAEPSLAQRVRALYTYMYTRLLEGSMEKSVAKVDEVIGLLQYERETWALFLERLAGERAAGGVPAQGEAGGGAKGPAPSRPAPAMSSLSLSA